MFVDNNKYALSKLNSLANIKLRSKRTKKRYGMVKVHMYLIIRLEIFVNISFLNKEVGHWVWLVDVKRIKDLVEIRKVALA